MSTNHEEVSSPVRQLRESFGDPKPPAITRKITACVACRKQKIKCHMRDSQPPCTRCKKRNLPCTVNRSLQMLLESDTTWKHEMENKMNCLEALVHTLSNQNTTSTATRAAQVADADPLPQTSPLGQLTNESHQEQSVTAYNTPNSVSNASQNLEIVIDLDSGPGTAPGFHISQGTAEQRSKSSGDIISLGIISLESAQRYFDNYVNRLDHFPYRVLAPKSNLSQIRSKSPLLVAAICTVGALHLSEAEFETCYTAFVSQCACQMFSKSNTVDDVRAFVIGALWLSDISWTLASAAVRIAIELQLHRSYYQALQGDSTAYLNARLYYLVYACDHQASVFFGRPPLTRQCYAIRNIRNFLNCKDAKEDDARLTSHVLRLSLITDVFDTFGVDTDRPLSQSEVVQVREFATSLSNLRAEWIDRFRPNAHIGNYPKKGVTLQYHFANLYICSHVFRGAKSDLGSMFQDSPTSNEIQNLGSSAVSSALSILNAMAEDNEIQSFFDGLPTYFDIMAAFAAVFLVKVTTKFPSSLHCGVREANRTMESTIQTLQKVTQTMHQRHILVQITKGIEGLLQYLIPKETESSGRITRASQAASFSADQDIQRNFQNIEDPYFIDVYDFLLNTDGGFGNYPFDSLGNT